MKADRNLLIGIFALQMDFIRPDQFTAALNAWLIDKSRPIEAWLLDEGHLSAERCELLRSLVAEHSKEHDDDPRHGPRTVSPNGTDLERIARHDSDPEAHATIEFAASDRVSTQEFVDSLGFSVGESSSAGTRFRILRPHAQGGLGLVSVALDEELGREVALKEIQARYATDENSRNRFVMEAEVIGGLEHPGIVPIYGMGQYADGRPFYAMRFIRGVTFKEAIDQFHHPQTKSTQDATTRGLALRGLLGRLIAVCNAIEFAHNRGVLHRDLKPDNIMLGKFGETLVVDWGLAKIVGRDQQHDGGTDERPLQLGGSNLSAATVMGSAMGTPAYMSPEQAAGRLDQLGPASDVYGLGSTLYYLLTGRSPFEEERNYGDLLRRVQSGQFPHPRERVRDVSPPLEAICLRAMNQDPAARYASPRELAEDLEHWLADEAVAAYRETFGQKLGRWERKHRSYVRAGGVALLLISTVSIAAAVGINKARQEETFQRMRADETAESALEAEREARANLARALGAEAETVKALAKAESEAKSSKDISDFLVNLFLGSDPTGLGGGISALDARGKNMSAVDLLRYGAAALHDQADVSPEVRARLMDTLGFIFTTYSEFQTAELLLNESLKIRRERFGDRQAELADSLKNNGIFYFLTGDYRKARKYDREALDIRRERFDARSGQVAEMEFYLGWHLSTGYTNASLLKESEGLLRSAVAIQKELYAPGDKRLIVSQLALAYTLLSEGKSAEAMLLLFDAIPRLSAGGDSRPAEIITNMIRGRAAESRKNWKEATDYMGRALELVKVVFGEGHAFVPYFQGSIVQYLERDGNDAAAEKALRDLVAAERKIYAKGHWVSFRLDDLASFLVRHERYEEAEQCYTEALAIRKAVVDDDCLFIGANLHNLADVARKKGDRARAEQLCREAIAVYDRAKEDHPDTVSLWRAKAAESLVAIQAEKAK